MGYGKEENLLSNTFMFLEASATYWQIETTKEKWIPRLMSGYSTNSSAYRVFKSITKVVMESINVVINDVSEDKVLDVESDVGTSVHESTAPIQVNESESKKGEMSRLSKIMLPQVKVLPSKFRRIILKILL